ncbi:MAG: glutathione S-transferase [Pseudomonadota bacterium]
MITILGRRTSGNVMKPLWVADEIGIPFEQVDIGGSFGGNDDADYRAKNPMGLVPTLIDGDFVLWESNAITRYLSAKHDTGGLCPSDPQERALADQWMDWKLTAINPVMRPIFWGLVRTPAEERNEAEIKAGIDQGVQMWDLLDRHLAGREFIVGDRLTMADIPLGPQAFRWFELVKDRPSMPHLEAWYARLCERPAFKTHCMNPLV